MKRDRSPRDLGVVVALRNRFRRYSGQPHSKIDGSGERQRPGRPRAAAARNARPAEWRRSGDGTVGRGGGTHGTDGALRGNAACGCGRSGRGRHGQARRDRDRPAREFRVTPCRSRPAKTDSRGGEVPPSPRSGSCGCHGGSRRVWPDTTTGRPRSARPRVRRWCVRRGGAPRSCRCRSCACRPAHRSAASRTCTRRRRRWPRGTRTSRSGR